jgi:putative transposase
LEECGVPIDHATIQRWVVKYSPLLEEAFHRRKRPVWVSWRMDETSIKIKGQWYYLYRAVDKTGQTMDFLLTEQRDEQAAKRFLTKAIRRHGVPEKITIDGSAANEAAIKRYNAEHGTAIAIRKIKYVNNIVEQDHRGVKRVTRPLLGFKSFEAAQGTLVGIELMQMIKKKQLMVEAGDEGRTAAEQFYALAASSPHRQGLLPLHRPPEQNLRQSCHAPQGHHESCKCRPWDRNLQGSHGLCLSNGGERCRGFLPCGLAMTHDKEAFGHTYAFPWDHMAECCRTIDSPVILP